MSVRTYRDSVTRKAISILLIIMGLFYLVMFTPQPVISVVRKSIVRPEAEKIDFIEITIREITEEKEQKTQEMNASDPKSVKPNTNPDDLMATGKKLLGDKGQNIGSFPDIIVNYQKHLGTVKYIKTMRRLGSRFFVMNLISGDIVAGIDFDVKGLNIDLDFSGLSPRSRLIRDEPSFSVYVDAVRKVFGNKGSYGIVMLVPVQVDHRIIGTLSDVVKKFNHNIKDYSRFKGEYRIRNNRLYLEIHRGEFKNKPGQDMDISISLNV